MLIESGFHVDESATGYQFAGDFSRRQLLVAAVRHGRHDGVGARQLGPADRAYAVFVHGFIGVGIRVGDDDFNAVGLQLVNDVDDLGVAQVGAVLLEGQAQHIDAGALDATAAGDHLLDGLLGNEFTHAVIDAPAGQDDLRVVAQHVGLVGQVVGIDADAMAADQARLELQEVPFGAGGFQHLGGVTNQPY